jgi:Flp pilus assembly pilin Flp
MTGMVQKFRADESGATAIQDGLMGAGLNVVDGPGIRLNTSFTSIDRSLIYDRRRR